MSQSDGIYPSDEKRFSQATVGKNAEFAQKRFLFPPEFNALRKELETYWQSEATCVWPGEQYSILYAMVFDAPMFVLMMNRWLEMHVAFDTGAVQHICRLYLNELEKRRRAQVTKNLIDLAASRALQEKKGDAK